MAMIDLCERGLVPDALTRYGIRRLCAQRLKDEGARDAALAQRRYRELLARLGESPIAIETAAANEQHYEVPTRFFQLCLGRRLKYSSCYYPTGRETLDEAEEAMLALYGERAQLSDGQQILELGCGWGSLTLWMAERYPNARITAVSNSNGQREHIEAQCRKRGWMHVRVVTCDVNRLQLAEGQFDRCVSIEMFEHMRNYDSLFGRIRGWLEPGGMLFAHIFCHRQLMYPFETEGEDNWMGRHFFTGGLMPSADTLVDAQTHLPLQQRWLLPGTHYQRTADHWLANQDRHRDEVLAVLREAYGDADAQRWHQRWRMFWMACAELFGYDGGREWLVAHYRFAKT
ncbi:SAM-dependent methyltransferase [Arenimonas sp.]|uniref:SAM-dependent methyltransferase n=1 Tax=Arenimonas sp. TaxID=1872635 RepID=UPI0039E70D93